MPFDCTPVLDTPKAVSAIGDDAAETRIIARTEAPIRVRPVPAWYVNGRAERVEAAIAVLSRARDLIADEQCWCKRSLARGWLDVPVPVQSGFARRFCAIGAIQRVARELGLPFNDAGGALEWQTARPKAGSSSTLTMPTLHSPRISGGALFIRSTNQKGHTI